jgi:hypothetical protein
MEDKKSPKMLLFLKDWSVDKKITEIIVFLKVQKKRILLIPRETLEMVLKLDTSKLRAYIGMNDKKEKYINFCLN